MRCSALRISADFLHSCMQSETRVRTFAPVPALRDPFCKCHASPPHNAGRISVARRRLNWGRAAWLLALSSVEFRRASAVCSERAGGWVEFFVGAQFPQAAMLWALPPDQFRLAPCSAVTRLTAQLRRIRSIGGGALFHCGGIWPPLTSAVERCRGSLRPAHQPHESWTHTVQWALFRKLLAVRNENAISRIHVRALHTDHIFGRSTVRKPGRRRRSSEPKGSAGGLAMWARARVGITALVALGICA